MKLPKSLLIILGVVAFAGFWLMGTYNGLVGANQQVEASWAQVETQYQRRFDLIPNLVEATKGTMAQEQDVFKAIADARGNYAGAATQDEKAAAAGQVESALGRLLVIMENYPTLNSNETVLSLMDELAGTENRVGVERGRYNEQVRSFNTKVKTMPTALIAGMFGFDAKEFFEAVEAAEAAPAVDLDLGE